MRDEGTMAVDAYQAALPARQQKVMKRLRLLIRKAAPEASERIAYRIPVFAYHGDLVGMSAHRDHLSLHTMSPPLVEAMTHRLSEVGVSGATIHFAPDQPLPASLIAEIVAARIEENLARRPGERRTTRR